jgi:DNA-(apurinic or apyrimidinic site) lyase
MSGNKNINVRKKLVEILSKIPWKAWEEIVRKEPEWQNMESFFLSYDFGPFAVLMLATGLNDYQLKGKAEVAYWPNIRKVLKISPSPKSPNDLCKLLIPFYQKERLNINKIERLKRFLKSPLASRLWKSSPQRVSSDFLNIWDNLAKIMHQQPQAKTIVFAMKCLGISLLIVKEYGFDFTPIPVPIDLRVMRFTKLLGFNIGSDSDVRAFWNDILSILREGDSHITMIHLDSLIWQIASMNKYEMQKYFRDLYIPKIGEHLCVLLQS